MENDPEKVAIGCPACGGERTEFSFQKNDFDLHRCRVCGHIFIYPLSYDALSLYDVDYFMGAEKGSGYVDYEKDKEPMRPVFVEYLKRIEKFLPQKGVLLDIGAATGFFMKIADGLGWNAKGLEISKYAADVAKEDGLDMYCGTLEGSHFAERSFDVITLWDVLEHLPDPQTDLRIIASLLKPGGILAINTPDSGSLYARMMGKRWHLFVPPEHINYFTERSMTIFLEENGFSVEIISKIGKSFTLSYIVQVVASWQRSSVLQKLASSLGRHPRIGHLSIPINLHDNMFVIAKKK